MNDAGLAVAEHSGALVVPVDPGAEYCAAGPHQHFCWPWQITEPACHCFSSAS